MDIWSAITWFVTLPGVQSIVLIVTALATAGSVIVALSISSRAAGRQGTRDQIEAAARLERRAERQAVLILVEVVPVWDPPGSYRNDNGVQQYIIRVYNPSPLAIHRPTPYLWLKRMTELYKDPIDIPAWGQEVDTMEPNSMLEFLVSYEDDGTNWAASAHCGFGDAFGDAWDINTYGSLTLQFERNITRDILGH